MYSISPHEPVFWDRADAAAEMARVFDVCNGCRLCDKLCPSFNDLFDRIEAIDDEQTKAGRTHDNPVHGLTEADSDHVTDVCYQCKLCYPKCPYTPPHEYQLDFPRLLLRWQAIRTKERGGHMLQNMALANADRVGAIGSAVPALMNWANRNPVVRAVMEATAGIHRNKRMPLFYGETFAAWYARHTRAAIPATSGKVAFFYTCTVNNNAPHVGKACVEVLEHNGVEIVVPPQQCCGMPQLGAADYPAVTAAVDANVARLLPLVDAGFTIVTSGPSCGFMIRQEYAHLATRRDDAERVARATMDICEYLVAMHKRGALKTDFRPLDATIAYHLPCHLKAQNIGFKSRDLMNLIPGVHVETIQQCSGHDGSWSMKKEYYEISLQVGKKLFDKVEAASGRLNVEAASSRLNVEAASGRVASDCLLAHLHIHEGTGKDARHPIEIVHEAYGL